MMNSDYAAESDYWREQDAIENAYRTELLKHPHCLDPDHPGCEKCEVNDD